MSTTTRTWIAAILLAASVLILTLSSHPGSLGTRAGLGMLVVFVHVWVIAVGERACISHGGLRIKRFPLAPRLLSTDPGLYPQLVVMIVLLGLVTASPIAAGVALLIVTTLYVRFLRVIMPILLPVAALLMALVGMDEFHHLGDLVQTAKGWLLSAVWFLLAATAVAGPLMRTDASPGYSKVGWPIVIAAGIPGYVAAIFLVTRTIFFTHPNLAPMGQDVFAIGLVLILGGIFQSLIVGAVAAAADLVERDPEAVPLVSAHRVGQALMPMLSIVVCWQLFTLFPLDEASAGVATASAWGGLMMLMTVVPMVPAAVLVALSLDRADGAAEGRGARLSSLLAYGLLGGWFLLGPDALRMFYAPDGIAAGLRTAFRMSSGAGPVAAPDAGAGGLVMYGIPLTELCRAATLMTTACAALSVRFMRQAPAGHTRVGWKRLAVLLILQVGLSWWLMPELGASGAPLAAALASVMLLGVSLVEQLLQSAREQEEAMAEAEQGDDDGLVPATEPIRPKVTSIA